MLTGTEGERSGGSFVFVAQGELRMLCAAAPTRSLAAVTSIPSITIWARTNATLQAFDGVAPAFSRSLVGIGLLMP